MDRIPTKDENPDGLHQRYRVEKSDGTPTDYGAEYFILRLDEGAGDPAHLEACRAGVLRYAEKIKATIPQLAADLRNRYGNGMEEEDRNSAEIIQKDVDFISEIVDKLVDEQRTEALGLLHTWRDELRSSL